MDVWVEGSDRGEANQRLAPMTVPIKDEVQVLPDELVGTQIAFELVDEDHPPLYE